MSTKDHAFSVKAFVTVKPEMLPKLPRGVRARLAGGRIGQFVGLTKDGVPIVKWHGTSDERKEFNEHYPDISRWMDEVTDEAAIAEHLAAAEAYRKLRAERRETGAAGGQG